MEPPTPTHPEQTSVEAARNGEPRARAVTLRSVLLGLAGVLLICGFTPYNDFAVANTFGVGNFLPILLVLFVLVLVLVLNLPLLRWLPGYALRESELAVILAMTLVSCSLPTSGLMRYLPAGLVGINFQSAENPTKSATVEDAHLPTWLYPAPTNDDEHALSLINEPALTPTALGNSDVYKYYYSRDPGGEVPWRAWIRPFAIWGIFVALLWGLMMFLCVIARRQWAENERLAFPLATVYSALIEAPERGRIANALFRSTGFWIAVAGVFVLHGFNGLNQYFPRVPALPLGYDFIGILADPPIQYASFYVKRADIYFSIVGIAFFLQTKISFSIWFFFILLQGALMIMGSSQIAFTAQMQQDQTFGGLLVMSAMIFYVGRHHWWLVARHMVGAVRPNENESRYLPYWLAGWGAVACMVGLIVWLVVVGASVIGAIVISLTLIMLLMMVARILAETGLAFVQIGFPMYRVWYYPMLIPSEPVQTTPTTFFMAGWVSQLFHDLRESFAGFFITSLRVADNSAYEGSHRWRTGFSFILAIVLALVVGYVTAAASTLWTEYNYAATLVTQSEQPINGYAINNSVQNHILTPADAYARVAPEAHNMSTQIGIGAVITALCGVLRLTLSWWPLHPIGFIVLYSYATGKVWFSLFIGWLAKVLIVRLGGATLLRAGRNVFIGLIVGEATAAAFWLVFSLAAHWMGYEYHRVALLPL